MDEGAWYMVGVAYGRRGLWWAGSFGGGALLRQHTWEGGGLLGEVREDERAFLRG